MSIPAMELPKVLKSALQTILDSNILLSWNIFQNRNGSTSVKLKFSGHDNNMPQQSSYKRISQKRASRDHHRAQLHQSNKRANIQTEREQSVETVSVSANTTNDSHPRQTVSTQCDYSQSGVRTQSMAAGNKLEDMCCDDEESILSVETVSVLATTTNASHPRQTVSTQCDYSQSGVRTRSMAASSKPEVMRSDHEESSLNPMADSFIFPQQSPKHLDKSCSDLDIEPELPSITSSSPVSGLSSAPAMVKGESNQECELYTPCSPNKNATMSLEPDMETDSPLCEHSSDDPPDWAIALHKSLLKNLRLPSEVENTYK